MTSSSWSSNALATGHELYDFSRLRYISNTPHCPLHFEIIKMQDKIIGLISLERFHFTHTETVLVTIKVDDVLFEEAAPVHEGGMRLSLSEENTRHLIRALQEGKHVCILADGFEEVLEPSQFSSSFSQFMGEKTPIK
ncbi:MAG: hypothetical protein ACD_17C00486G0003 [uncultured bacterium]|nr:MAG: hypothetical protein ACD_17C00486G0003 [uncultured bacterium]OGN71251.1 MAG: hypothetical protein A3F79_02805 [Chlamydiae bacterium RIFCSPLOWO2_12_FULL_45_20]